MAAKKTHEQYKKPWTEEKYIEECKKIHGDKYEYINIGYRLMLAPVKITCKKHGMFECLASNHLHSKTGCKKCGYLSYSKKIIEGDEIYRKCKNCKSVKKEKEFYKNKRNSCSANCKDCCNKLLKQEVQSINDAYLYRVLYGQERLIQSDIPKYLLKLKRKQLLLFRELHLLNN